MCCVNLEVFEVVLLCYVEWVESLLGKLVFVVFLVGFDFMFMFWYMMCFVGCLLFGWVVFDIKMLVFVFMGMFYWCNVKVVFFEYWYDLLLYMYIVLDDVKE